MREKIIFAPGVNGSELCKSLALHGVPCLNFRICGSGEYARMILMRSGIPIAEDFLSAREEAAIVAKVVKEAVDESIKRGEQPYFGEASYSDIQEITGAIRKMRCLVIDDEEEVGLAKRLGKGIFQKKNQALFLIYQKYMRKLSNEKKLDAVSLIRRAIAQGKTLDADILIVEEYPLCPLEKSLLEKSSDGKYQKVKLSELFWTQAKGEAPLKLESIQNCHGASNEVEIVLESIYKQKSLDQCTIAVTDEPVYGQLFFDYAVLYDIPITFGFGIPIINSNPAKLLSLYYQWLTGGFFGKRALIEMISSPAFNRQKLYEQFPGKEEGFHLGRFYNVLGGLRLTNHAQTNERRLRDFEEAVKTELDLAGGEAKKYQLAHEKELCIPYLKVMAEILAKPAEEFISQYAYIRKGSRTNREKLVMLLDMSAKQAIYEELILMKESGEEQVTEEMVQNVMKLSVCEQKSEGGNIHLTNIDKARTAVRENLYLMGFSASKFPRTPKENYLLLDNDLDCFGEGGAYLKADGQIARKREQLQQLVHLASDLGAEIFLSYAGLNVSELKKDNASSVVYELYREKSGKNVDVQELEAATKRIGYFEPAISATRKIGEAYNKGFKISRKKPNAALAAPKTGTDAGQPEKRKLDKEYSPTALETFFQCKKRFMLAYLLGIPEPEDERPFEVISAMDNGTMAHSLLEELANSGMPPEEFLKLSENYFDRFIMEHPPLLAESVDPIKEQFQDMMVTAYEMNANREVILKEKNVQWEHESGVKLHGYPDRIEKNEDGACVVVDFKSGRNIRHTQDDIETCLQVLIYAYLMEQQGEKVNGGEYRYIRLGKKITCKYDEEMKKMLSEKLEDFKDSYLKGNFPIAQCKLEDEPCKYCKYFPVCGKEKGDD